jgi:hypothetical protein
MMIWRFWELSSSDSILVAIELASEVVTIGFCASTAYRAFSLSKALPGHIHRNRAEWIGSFSIFLIGVTAVNLISALGFFGTFATNFSAGVYSYVSAFLAVFLLAWLSSTIDVAAELDFFHRDPLHWSSLKRYFWILGILGIGGLILMSVSELNPCVSANCSFIELVSMIGGLGGLLLIALIVFALFVLYFSSRKVNDKIFKRHINWLELFTIILVFGIVTTSGGILFAVATYFLFRTSDFLTPAEKIEAISIHGEEPTRKKALKISPSLKYRVIALILLAFSLFLAGIILNDDGLLKKLAPGNAEAFASVTIVYGILLVLLATKVKIGFYLGLLSSILWLFAQIANVLIPVNSFVTASNIALFFPQGFTSYLLGLAPVHNATLCPYTCPPLQYSALISLVIQVPLVLSCYFGLRAEKKASFPKTVGLTATSGDETTQRQNN